MGESLQIDPFSAPALETLGFTPAESGKLIKWIEQGKPGLAKHRAEELGACYALGYTAEDLCKHTDFPIEVLLYSRVRYKWDELRAAHTYAVTAKSAEAAGIAKLDSVKFLSELVAATHLKWRAEMLKYIANPNTEKPPEWLPSSIGAYGKLVELLQGLTEVKGVPSAAPVQIYAAAGSTVAVSSEKSRAVKEALMKDVSEKK